MLHIFNEVIETSTALYEYNPRSSESMTNWFKTKQDGHFPILGATGASGRLLGFASYGHFRAWPAYKYSIEHSIYVHPDHRRRGVGRMLLLELLAVAKQQGYHVMVGGIDIENEPSIALHLSLGFVHAGTIRHAGFKFGKWLNLGFYQIVFETPDRPVDD